MRLAVLGSGSRGNAIAVRSGNRTLLIDVGFGLRSLARRALQARLSIEHLDAIVLTHEHGDHARGAAALARRHGTPVYASAGTLRALRVKLGGVEQHVLPLDNPVPIDPFRITACRTSHDAVEPVALAIEEGDQRLGIAYDLGTPTPGVRTLLSRCTCLILETNHDEAMLHAGPYPPSVRRRIGGRGGHLSNAAAAQLVDALWHDGLQTVVLAHLSDRCNRPSLASHTVRTVLAHRGFRGRLLVARQATVTGPLDIGARAQLQLDLS